MPEKSGGFVGGLMFIVHVVESFAAGTFRVLQTITNAQVADGHRVCIFYSLREETPVNWQAQFDGRIMVKPLPMTRRLAPLKDLQALKQLFLQLRTLRPDIVHLHSSKAGALGRICSLLLKGPRWFFSPHGLSFLQSEKQGKVHRFYLWIERLLAHAPATIIACSPSEAVLVEQYLHRKAVLVCNGIDATLVTERSPIKNQVCSIGSAGRLTLARNPGLFAWLAESMAGCGVSFFWLGGGGAIDELQLRKAGVQVSGWLEHEQVLEQMSHLDIYVQPSLWEGLPIAVLEAMATGLPVLVSDVVGNRDLIQHERTGLIAAKPADFLNALERLVKNPDLRARLGAAARAEVLEHYSIRSMMENLYRGYGL